MRKQKGVIPLVVPPLPMAPLLLPQPRTKMQNGLRTTRVATEEVAPMIPDDIQGCSPTTQRVLPSSLVISPGHHHLFALRIDVCEQQQEYFEEGKYNLKKCIKVPEEQIPFDELSVQEGGNPPGRPSPAHGAPSPPSTSPNSKMQNGLRTTRVATEEVAPMIPDDIQGCSPTTQRVLPSSLVISPGHHHVLCCSPSNPNPR
ncbi:hypothetical protein U9M48_032931 [Paspalum notatum var. saurae]|uniref:Uncharacterized protein n=1 Tax=Paspalum notatum var. saurae TaxID=547442 RepID=A0AAQ3X5U8_PASNO